jgi:two-component system cell cycle response regulator
MLLCSLLAANQYQAVKAIDLDEAVVQMRDGGFDLVLAGLNDANPATLMRSLRDRRIVSAVDGFPPVLCLDPQPTAARRLDALKAGAREVLPCPLPDSLLLARLRGILREAHGLKETRRRQDAAASFGFAEAAVQFTNAGRVAVVSARGIESPAFARFASMLGQDVVAMTPETALFDDHDGGAIDAFVLDGASLPRGRVLEVLPELRARPHSRHAAILVLHSDVDAGVGVLAMDSGASDVAPAGSLQEELVLRVRAMLRRKAADDALRQTSETSLRLAATDPLTGLYNRRYAQAYLDDAVRTARTGRRPFTVMMLDIDHFKQVNDEFGHAAGDSVLREVAHRMRQNLRAIDLVARFGGEEFLIVLPATDAERAVRAADRLRTRIAGIPVDLEDGRKVSVTVSIGVTVSARHKAGRSQRSGQGGAETVGAQVVTRLIGAADTALYSAKLGGRNRVEMAINPA